MEGKLIKLKIWDTAGQEKYKAIAKLYYKDCQVALIIFDVTRRQTFTNLALWAEELIKHAPKNVGTHHHLFQSSPSWQTRST